MLLHLLQMGLEMSDSHGAVFATSKHLAPVSNRPRAPLRSLGPRGGNPRGS